MQFILLVGALLVIVAGVMTGNALLLMVGVVTAGIVLRTSGVTTGGTSVENRWASGFHWLRQASQYGWGLGFVAALGISVAAGQLSMRAPFRRDLIWIWLAGMLLCVATALWQDYQNGRTQALPVGEDGGDTRATQKQAARWKIGDSFLLVALVAVAVGLRLWRLDNNLPGIHGDEGEMGRLALLALYGPASAISSNPLPYFSTAFLDHPTLFHYLQAGALLLFGETMNGLRILSILTGGLVVGGLYLIGWEGWGRGAAIFAAGFGAVSHFYIHYSRIALNNIQSVLCAVILVWLFIRIAGKSGQSGDQYAGKAAAGAAAGTGILPFVWIGLLTGISQYLYYGSRLLPLLVVTYLLFLLFQRRVTLIQAAVVLVTAFVAVAPILIYFSNQLYTFLNRMSSVSVLKASALHHILGPNAVWPNDLPALLWKQIDLNLTFFINRGDFSPFYLPDIPAFDRITVLLLWLGLAPFLVRTNRFPEFAVASWLLGGVFVGGVLTIDAPNGPRLLMVGVTVFLIVGALIQYALQIARRYIGAGAGRGVLVAAFVALVIAAGSNYQTYFDTYYHAHPNAMPSTLSEEMLNSSPRTVYLFGAPAFFVEYGVVRFVARNVRSFNVDAVSQLPTPEEVDEKGALIVALPFRAGEIDGAAQRLPGGTRGETFDRLGRLLYYTYRYPAESK